MDPVLIALTTFPTAIWSVIAGVVAVYWLLVGCGLLGIDLIPFDAEVEGGEAGDVAGDGGDSGPGGITEALALGAVPITIVITSIGIIGFILSLTYQLLLMPLLPGGVIMILVGIAALLASLLVSVWLTTFVVHPLKPAFRIATVRGHSHLIGGLVTVTSSKVTGDFGTGTHDVHDSPGNELQLNIICEQPNDLTVDAMAAITDYDETTDVYTVVPVSPALIDTTPS
jgi:hypothetical protein